jgi:hypothetical protein
MRWSGWGQRRLLFPGAGRSRATIRCGTSKATQHQIASGQVYSQVFSQAQPLVSLLCSLLLFPLPSQCTCTHTHTHTPERSVSPTVWNQILSQGQEGRLDVLKDLDSAFYDLTLSQKSDQWCGSALHHPYSQSQCGFAYFCNLKLGTHKPNA